MPVISRFYGIIIMMYYKDHQPPHFHAKYGAEEIKVEIECDLIKGQMSSNAVSKVKKWKLDC